MGIASVVASEFDRRLPTMSAFATDEQNQETYAQSIAEDDTPKGKGKKTDILSEPHDATEQSSKAAEAGETEATGSWTRKKTDMGQHWG